MTPTDKDRLLELADSYKAAGISAAKDAPHNSLFARRAFYNLSVAAGLRAIASKRPVYTNDGVKSESGNDLTQSDDLRSIVQRFLAAYDRCEPHINNCILISTMHHAPYDGPSMEKELAELREAVANRTGAGI